MRFARRPTLWCLVALLAASCNRPTPTEQIESSTDATTSSQTSAVDANAVLTSALAQAASADKNVLVHLGAPW